MPRAALPGLSTDPANPDTWGGWYNAVLDELSDRIDAVAVNVLEYGTNAAAIDLALADVAAGGTVLFPGGSTFTTAGGHIVPRNVFLMGYGATIVHTGDNVCFKSNSTSSFDLAARGGVIGMRITGNAGTSAVAIEAGNQWGFTIRDVNIKSYTTGLGILLNNVTNWCEGTTIDNVKVDSTKFGLRFNRTTGTNSFAYTRIRNFSHNVPADGIAIDLGSTSPSAVYLYNCEIQGAAWLNGNNAAGLVIGATASGDTNRMYFTGEVFSGTPVYGVQNLGGTMKAFGYAGVKGASDSLALGVTRILPSYKTIDTKSGVNGASEAFRAFALPNPDLGHEATFGYITATNNSTPFTSAYDQSTDTFRVYKTPNNGVPGVDGVLVFRVSSTGAIYPANGAASIFQGAGTPEASRTASPGAIFIQTDGAGRTLLWVKATGTGSVGWTPMGVAKTGIANLVAGTVTVSDTAVTATTSIQITTRTLGGTPGALFISAKSVGASFTISSTSATDTSTVRWEVIAY